MTPSLFSTKSAVVPVTPVVMDLRAFLEEHMDALWRFVRRMGVTESDADDVVQEISVVLARRIREIDPATAKAFLFGTAYKIATRFRDTRRKSRGAPVELLEQVSDLAPRADEALDDARRRALLDALLGTLPDDVRAVFVLCEVEEETMANVAVILDLAPGTVASRLRRGREQFDEALTRLQRRLK